MVLGIGQARFFRLAERKNLVQIRLELLTAPYQHHKAIATHHIIHLFVCGTVSVNLVWSEMVEPSSFFSLLGDEADDVFLVSIHDERPMRRLFVRAVN